MRPKPRKRTILLALTSTHHGFYRGAARYATEHDWHVVADTILQEILRVRVNHAQKLLETTSLSVTDVAARSGFVNLNHFFCVFHARTAVTPRAFRLARSTY